jgi:hypothetical protein
MEKFIVAISYVVLSTLMIYLANAGLFFPDYASADKSIAPSTNATAAPSANAMIKAKLAQLKAEHPVLAGILNNVQSMNGTETLKTIIGIHALERILDAHALNLLAAATHKAAAPSANATAAPSANATAAPSKITATAPSKITATAPSANATAPPSANATAPPSANATAAPSKITATAPSPEEAIRIKPDFAKAWYNKGISLRMLGEQKGADQCFTKARELGLKP